MIEDMELPKSWVWASLESLTNRIGDVDHKMPSAIPLGIPYISTKNFYGEDGIDFKSAKQISHEDYIALSRKIKPENGDILLSRYGTVGEVRKVTTDIEFQASYSIAIIKTLPIPNISVYLVYVLQSELVQRQMKRDIRATAQPDLGLEYIRLLEIPLPPLPEQHRIVSAIEQQFSRLDAGVAALQRAKAKLKRYRAAVLKAAVEGKLTETWRAEHPMTEPSSLARKRILTLVGEKSSNVNDKRRLWGAGHVTGILDEASSTLPTTWELCKVRNLGHDSDNVVQIGPMSMKSSEFMPEGVPVLNVGCVKWGYFDLSKLDFLPLELATKFSRYRVKAGDVIFTRSGTVGRCAIIDKDKDNWLMTFHLLRVRVDVRICLPEYLMYVFEGFPPVRAQITSASIGSTRAGFNTRLLEELDIPLPPLQEQEQIIAEIAQRLSIITALENTIEANLKRAERLRQSILQEAFAGRLVPQDPTDEPASVLLERIRDERNGQKHGLETSIKKNHSVKLPESATINIVDAEQTELWESVGN